MYNSERSLLVRKISYRRIIKLTIPFVVVLVLITAVVSAAVAPGGIHEPGTGIQNPELQEAGQGSGQGQQARLQQLAQDELADKGLFGGLWKYGIDKITTDLAGLDRRLFILSLTQP
jgi:hypothetical protein